MGGKLGVVNAVCISLLIGWLMCQSYSILLPLAGRLQALAWTLCCPLASYD